MGASTSPHKQFKVLYRYVTCQAGPFSVDKSESFGFCLSVLCVNAPFCLSDTRLMEELNELQYKHAEDRTRHAVVSTSVCSRLSRYPCIMPVLPNYTAEIILCRVLCSTLTPSSGDADLHKDDVERVERFIVERMLL